MSVRELSDVEADTLIELWKNEPVLWDVSISQYADANERSSALACISEAMDGLATRKFTVWLCLFYSSFLV